MGKASAVTDIIWDMVSTLGEGLIDHPVLVLVGFASAARREELVSFDMEDVQFTCEGLVLNLCNTKTDQEGVGRKIAITTILYTVDRHQIGSFVPTD